MQNYEVASNRTKGAVLARYDKATDLVDSEAVTLLHTTSHGGSTTLVAKVEGSADEPYKVSMTAFCSCPDKSRGFVCKHLQAVLTAWNRSQYSS